MPPIHWKIPWKPSPHSWSQAVTMMGNQVPALRLGNQLSTQRVCIVAGEPSNPADGWGKPFSRWKSFHPKICSSKSCEARAHPGETCASWVMRGVWASEKNLAKFRFQKQMLCPIGKYFDWFMSSTWMNFHKPRSVPCEFFAEVMDFLLSDPEAGSSSS